MVLVRSPKRGGPWPRPSSPPRAAAAAGGGELTGGAAQGQALKRQSTAAGAAGSEGSNSLPAAAGDRGASAAVVAAAGAAAPSAADGRTDDQAERGPYFSSFSPRGPGGSTSRLSPRSGRKSASCVGFFFSEGSTHSSSTACRRPSPAAGSEARPTAAGLELRPEGLGAEARGAAASATGRSAAAAAARQATQVALPFSRSAARHLARTPHTAEAAGAAGHAAAAGAAAGGGGEGGIARRAPLLRRSTRVRAPTGEALTNKRDESLQPHHTHAAALGSTSVPKRMRFAQGSLPRGTVGRTETLRSTRESRGVIGSVRLPREPSTTAPAALSAGTAATAEDPAPLRRTPAAAAGSYSPRKDVGTAATRDPHRLEPTQALAGTAVSAAATGSAATTVSALAPAVPAEATVPGTTATPTAGVELVETEHQLPHQQSVQPVELLRQLPATRALHNYVQEATRSELLRRHREGDRGEATPAADSVGPGAAVAALSSATAAAAAGFPAPSAAHSAATKPPARATVAAARAAPAAVTARASSTPASSIGAGTAVPWPPVAATVAVKKAPAAPDAAAAPSSTAVKAAAVVGAVAAAAGGPVAATGGVWAPLAAAAGSTAAAAGWGGSSSNDELQQLVLPRTAEELLREWSPTVDNVIQRLCDIREEEKQVTQFIILEGRALRVLRHVSKALQKKRAEVAAVHATAAQQEAEQQKAHAESEKYFEIVHRQAEDAAGGQAHLEKRLKDTQQKKERLLRLRRQLYEEMFACALLREKKVELQKQLQLLKDTSATRETRNNALYQLLQRITRLRVLHPVHGHVLRAAVIPEGERHVEQQFEEEEDLLLPEEAEDARELLLQQRQGHEEDELLVPQQQQPLGTDELPQLEQEADIEDGHVRQQVAMRAQQQAEAVRLGEHNSGFGELRQQKQRTLAAVAAGDHRMRQRSVLQVPQQQRGICAEKTAAGGKLSAVPLMFLPGQHMAGNVAAGEEETAASGERDVRSLCTEPSTDGGDNCRRLIAAKTAGESALVTVDCRRQDSETGVCKDVNALWQLIEEAIGLSPE